MQRKIKVTLVGRISRADWDATVKDEETHPEINMNLNSKGRIKTLAVEDLHHVDTVFVSNEGGAWNLYTTAVELPSPVPDEVDQSKYVECAAIFLSTGDIIVVEQTKAELEALIDDADTTTT